MSIKKWQDATAVRKGAEAYLSLIGKTTSRSTVAAREGEHATAGCLTTFEIRTQIHFQPYDGATNYHNCKAFDVALAAVVRRKWSAIRDEAIALLREEEREASLLAEEPVKGMLAEIKQNREETQ